LLVGSTLIVIVSHVTLLAPIHFIRCDSIFLTLVPRDNSFSISMWSNLEHMPSSGEEFYLAPIHPLWSPSLVLQTVRQSALCKV
jgi:hypothetical protein